MGFRSTTTKADAQLILVSLALLALLAYTIIMANAPTKVSAPRPSFPQPDLHAIRKYHHPLEQWRGRKKSTWREKRNYRQPPKLYPPFSPNPKAQSVNRSRTVPPESF